MARILKDLLVRGTKILTLPSSSRDVLLLRPVNSLALLGKFTIWKKTAETHFLMFSSGHFKKTRHKITWPKLVETFITVCLSAKIKNNSEFKALQGAKVESETLKQKCVT